MLLVRGLSNSYDDPFLRFPFYALMTSANGETYNITFGAKTWPGNSPFEINVKAISIARILSFQRPVQPCRSF